MSTVMDRVAGAVRRVDEDEVDDRLAQLMEERKVAIFNFLLALTRDRDTALECTQDTFVKAYEHLRRGKPVTPPWLYKVARNRATDEWRRHKRERSDLAELEGVPAADADGEQFKVRAALAELSSEDREILHLFIIDRFKTSDIASMLGIGPGAARMRISRARERFRLVYGDTA